MTALFRHFWLWVHLRANLAIQVRALREQRGWTQEELSERSGVPVRRIAAIEAVALAGPTIKTLTALASVFDVALQIRFVPWSEVVSSPERVMPEGYSTPTFGEEEAQREREAQATP